MTAVLEEVELKGFSTAESRWARFGPYYAMFPVDFAFEVVNEFSKPGDFVIDPFAGRCSSIYAGGVLGRPSVGIEINPVGWLYGSAKLGPAKKSNVLNRLYEIDSRKHYYTKAVERMPKFFRMCYCDDVLKFLLSARKNLNWRFGKVDGTLMSIVLVYLHGKVGEGLSNQMRMTKAMGPNYSMRWWNANGFRRPPEISAFDVISKKIQWRYAKGTPKIFNSRVIFGDSTHQLPRLLRTVTEESRKFSLLFTSPPYCDVTDYHADQWLRLWLLGGAEYPVALRGKNRGRFVARDSYRKLLDDVFGQCSKLMKRKSTIYVRTDVRNFTFDTTAEVLARHFPNHKLTTLDQPFQRRTQTALHGNSSSEKGEIDILLTR
jgi:DNA modification methylase